MATKFARPQYIRLSCLGASLDADNKLLAKPRTIPELKNALQRIWTALPQKSIAKGVKDFSKQFETCVPANVGHFEHKM